MHFKDMYVYLYRRLLICISKFIGRKGVVLLLSTVLLCNKMISDQIWFFIVLMIVFNIGGVQIASLFKKD